MITKMYAVSGMMCDGCVSTIKSAIKNIPEVIEAQVQLTGPQAIISMREEITTERLQQVISETGKYYIREITDDQAGMNKGKPSKQKLSRMFGIFQSKKDCCR